MDIKYSYEDFIEIIKTLRSPKGCPWDKEQTHKSLRPCLMEETVEYIAAVKIYELTNNADNMKEELGDILLQVIMHSQIAAEKGLFTIEDVIQGISEKMIRRHPHVFGTVKADNVDQVLSNWEQIKETEKQNKQTKQYSLREFSKQLGQLLDDKLEDIIDPNEI